MRKMIESVKIGGVRVEFDPPIDQDRIRLHHLPMISSVNFEILEVEDRA